MTDVNYLQQVLITASKYVSTGISNEKDFEVNPADVFQTNTYNEDFGGRYVLAPSTVDLQVGMGTVAIGRVLVIKPESDHEIKIVTVGPATTQTIKVFGGRLSILHIEFTGLLVSNPAGTAVKGRYFVAGD